MTHQKDQNDLILIVGGGPAGLGAALAFHNNNHKNIVVVEGRSDLKFDEENSYPVGINVRGKNALSKLFAPKVLDVSSMGLRVDQWKIFVGPGINVATFNSGLVTGTSRAAVNTLLYEETQRRGIEVLFGHKAKTVDLNTKTIQCEIDGQIKTFAPKCLVIADGYKSKARDSLAEQTKSFKVGQWPWTQSFRVLINTPNVTTNLSPFVHYIYNGTYISKLLNGRWSAVLSIDNNTSNESKLLTSTEPSDKNVDELMAYVKKKSPTAYPLFTRDEYRAYFGRNIFSGAVTKVSQLFVEDWAVLLGDAAHSAFPGTGEGINSALEDCFVLQTSLEKAGSSGKSLVEALRDFNETRLPDANALSDMAYSTANPSFKSSLQLVFLSTFKRFLGPSKEDMLFGTDSNVIKRYSDVAKHWKEQTSWLGGPNVPSF